MHPLPDRLTMLRAVWPWREPPILDFMRRQLADRGRVDLDDREQRLVLRLPDMSAPVHVRIERTDPPVRDVHPDMLSASTLERARRRIVTTSTRRTMK